MKNAVLITGSAGSGKTPLAQKIAANRKTLNGRFTLEGFVKKLSEGVEVIIIDEVSDTKQIEQYLPFISDPVTVDREESETFTVHPFFVFVSQQIRRLPFELEKHIATFELTSLNDDLYGIKMRNGNPPTWVMEAILEEMQRPSERSAKPPGQPTNTGIPADSPPGGVGEKKGVSKNPKKNDQSDQVV